MDNIMKQRGRSDAFLIVAGLAGGSGSGIAWVLAQKLKEHLAKPVYCLGVLPSTTNIPEDKAAYYLSNAIKSFRRLLAVADNMILFDNGNFERTERTRESMAEEYARYNQEIAKRLNLLFRADENLSRDAVPQEVVGTSETIAVLSGGGVSSIGYYEEDMAELRRAKKALDARLLERLVRESVSQDLLTYPCDIRRARRVLMVSYGQGKYLFSEGLRLARGWLEETMKVGKVLYGDLPNNRAKSIAVVTLISGITDLSRIEAMERRSQAPLEQA